VTSESSSDLISLAEARERVLAEVRALAPEEVPLPKALGRVLAEDVVSPHDLPPFDASAMDGFAVVAGPAAELAVVGESRAGRPASRSLGRGEAIRISTGAQIPEGADAVIPVERVAESDGRVQVPETPAGANVRRAGEDVRSGELVLAAGTELGPAEVAVLASLGRERVSCGARPRVAVACQKRPQIGPREKDEYTKAGARLLGTWPHGAVTVRSSAAGLIVETHRTGLRLLLRRGDEGVWR